MLKGYNGDGSLSVGLIVPSNNKAGPQKLAALCAKDLTCRGHRVSLFVPRLPYYFYFVTLRRQPIAWVRLVRSYIIDYIRQPSFSFIELLDSYAGCENVHIYNVLRRPSKRRLNGLDCLLVMTIAQVFELKDRYPQEKMIYQIHHPEESIHGHVTTLQSIRSTFKGKTIAISPFTARSVADHISEPPVVPDVVSTVFWKNRFSKDSTNRNKDILFNFSNKSSDISETLIQAIRLHRPGTRFTVWSSGGKPRYSNFPVLEGISESKLCDLYLSHKMLLFTSTYEGFGMPPIEAMACGCIPVLYSDVGASELYASDGENAIFIQDDIDKTAKRIVRMLDDCERLESMRAAAYRAIEPFSPYGYGIRLLSAAGIDV